MSTDARVVPLSPKPLDLSLEQLDKLLNPTSTNGVLATYGHANVETDDRFDGALVVTDARDAARFAREISAASVGSSTLDHIGVEIRCYASDYVSQSLSALFVDIRKLR